MTAAKRGQQNIKVFKGLSKGYRRKKKWLDQLLGSGLDRSGIRGVLMTQRDNCVRVLDKLTGAVAALEETLRDFSSERKKGTGRPAGPKTNLIRETIDQMLLKNPNLSGKPLHQAVLKSVRAKANGLGVITGDEVQREINLKSKKRQKVPSVE
jgi:hypothetical protein